MRLDFSKLEGFEWDSGNLEHIKKHRVNYQECEEAFLNRPFILSKDKAHSQIEERYQVLGKSNIERFLFLAFTIRSNKIRMISARDQNRKEKKEYQATGGEKR